MSGRVNIEGGTPFFLKEKVPNDDKTNYYNATKYMLQPSELSNTYFSKENIQKVHLFIKQEVYHMSDKKYVIDDQNIDTLKVIMRSFFLQYSEFGLTNIKEQVEKLNEMVVNHCSPNIYGEILGYLQYKKDASTMHKPMERPQYLHNDNTLELKNFF
jgi:hypothetical protein|tara:strand:+ start:5721 stop:6191 length:471 start_codon:yes stop_codon:yes gene_type:complete